MTQLTVGHVSGIIAIAVFLGVYLLLCGYGPGVAGEAYILKERQEV